MPINCIRESEIKEDKVIWLFSDYKLEVLLMLKYLHYLVILRFKLYSTRISTFFIEIKNYQIHMR